MRLSFREEFRRRWNVMFASIIGIGCGAIALPTAAISIFMRDLQNDFGWSRTQLSFTSTAVLAALAIAAPIVGWLADRFRTSLITGTSMAAMGCGFLILTTADGAFAWYLTVFVLTAFVAAGVSTIPFARAVSIAFPDNRGKALGLAMLGNGVSGILLPQLLVPLVASSGWRAGFVALAIVAFTAAPIMFVLMRIGETAPGTSRLEASDSNERGMSVREALGSRPFRLLAIAFLMIAFAAAGLQLHFVAILGDKQLSIEWIAWYTSAIGVALTLTRVVTGYLLDAYRAQYVSAGIMILGASAVVVFAAAGTWGSVFGAIAIGLTVGAEIDMVGYFSSRYFGFASYGRVYGLLYASTLVGTATSPLVYGAVKDAYGTYTPALIGAATLLGISAGLMMWLSRMPYPTIDPIVVDAEPYEARSCPDTVR